MPRESPGLPDESRFDPIRIRDLSTNRAHFDVRSPVLAHTHQLARGLDTSDVFGVQPSVVRDTLPGKYPVPTGNDRIETQKSSFVGPARPIKVGSMAPRRIGNGSDEDGALGPADLIDGDRQAA